MKLSMSSEKKLVGVHPDLVKIIRQAAADTTLEFIVTEGLRTTARQQELVKSGASQTMKSRHLTGHAVDLAVMVGTEARWDWPLYTNLALIVTKAAETCGLPIECGAFWKKFPDGPHVQLPWKEYP